MPTFQILYLRENVLDRTESVDVRDLLDAIDLAIIKAPDLTAEIRFNGERVGLVGPCLNEASVPSADATDDASQDQESEIAEEMKIRLQLVR